MRIGIDVSPLKESRLLSHRVRGTGFYIENLKKSLLEYYPQNEYVFFTREQKLPDDMDLIHFPYFEPFFLTLPFKKKYKTVVTVHDLIPFVFPQHFPSGIKGKFKWLLQKKILQKADIVITDSISSKRDIVKYAKIPVEKIQVIYLAAGEEFKKINISKQEDVVRKKYNLPNKFALYVGDATWNKNIPRIIEAIGKTDIPLVMVGKALTTKNIDVDNPWNQDLVKIQKLTEGNTQVIKLGFISNEDLVLLYNIAAVFIMPSLYEGFGLPILEAMSCGCPVITSKAGSIPEIGGDSVYYVDPYSSESISKGIVEVFSNKTLQVKLSKEGLLQSKKFTWKKTAEQVIKIYEKKN